MLLTKFLNTTRNPLHHRTLLLLSAASSFHRLLVIRKTGAGGWGWHADRNLFFQNTAKFPGWPGGGIQQFHLGNQGEVS